MTRFGTRRTVFVDATAFAALASASHPRHGAVREQFERLLDEYERGDTILVTHTGIAGDRHAEGGRRGTSPLSAVCEVEPLRGHIVREAQRTIEDHPELGLDLDRAAAIVLMARNRIGEILSLDELFDHLDVRRLPA